MRRYVHGPGGDLVLDAMGERRLVLDVRAPRRLARSEALLALHRLAVTPGQHERMWGRLRDDWDAFVVVPVDDRCLAHAVELGATYGLRTVDAVHLAAADRLPRPATYLTFDRRQIPAAAGLGFEVGPRSSRPTMTKNPGAAGPGLLPKTGTGLPLQATLWPWRSARRPLRGALRWA